MKYYRVLPEYDNVEIWKTDERTCKNLFYTILVGNELYTKRELDKLLSGATIHRVKKGVQIFEEVNISKNRTYRAFGARFAM